MEKRTNALSHAKPSGKYFIASLLILSGLLLLARNMEWISYKTFDTIVSWHSLLILIGIGKMMHRRYVGGSLLILIGTYFLLDRLSWLPENLHDIIWPAILVTAGILCLVKTHHRKRWIEIEMGACGLGKEKERDSRIHPNMEDNGQQCQSEDGYLRSDNAFGSVRHVVLDELFKGARIRASFGGDRYRPAPHEPCTRRDLHRHRLHLRRHRAVHPFRLEGDHPVQRLCRRVRRQALAGSEHRSEEYANHPWKRLLWRHRDKRLTYESASNNRLSLPLVSDVCVGTDSGYYPGGTGVGI